MLQRTVFVIMLLCALSAGASSLVPVPASQLDGTRYSPPSLGISLTAPSAEWQWLAAPAAQAPNGRTTNELSCVLPTSNQTFYVTIYSGPWQELDAAHASDYLAGFRKALERAGTPTEVLSIAPTEVPWPGSFRYSLRATGAGQSLFVHGYIATRGQLFAFSAPALEAQEPASFTTFARSLTVDTAAPPPPSGQNVVPFAALFGYVIAIGVAWLVAALVNVVARRRLLNAGLVALALCALIAVVTAYSVMERMSRSGSIEPFKQGELLGEFVMGPFSLACLLCYALYRFSNRSTTRTLGD